MKALIFGSGGQLGRALAAAAEPGEETVGLSHDDCDIGDASAVAQALRRHAPDIVFNAAALTAVDAQEETPEEAMRINGAAPGHIAEACKAAGARLLHVSTDFVFDGGKGSPYLPGDPTGPASVYGKSKLAGEQAVQSGFPEAAIVRTAWVYAAQGGNFVNTMLRLMGERDELGIVADQIGTPTHAASLARGLWALARAGATGIHHFTDAGVASWYDFAVAIEEEGRALGLHDGCTVKPIRTEDYPTPAARPAYSVLDKSSTWALTGTPDHWRIELRKMLAEKKALS